MLFSVLLGRDLNLTWTWRVRDDCPVAAVIFLHITLGLFIAKAYFRDSDQTKIKIGKED